MPHAVLIIEDEKTLASNLAAYLEMKGYEAHVTGDGKSGIAAHAKIEPDITLLDLRLPDMGGIDVLQRLQGARPRPLVIMMTAYGDVETAVEAMKAGAHDFLRKPLSLDEVKALIDRTIERERTHEAVRQMSTKGGGSDGLGAILGESRAIAELKFQIGKLVEAEARLHDQTPPPALITGETGTGKELVARAVHLAGPRRTGPFIELNCAALPTELAESELFGHERGAFTDARQRKIGLIEAADGGTLFLDEICEMDLGTQAKILKVIEDHLVRRVGGTRARRVDVRFVAATNRNPEASVAEGKFRGDLLFRLSVARFELPPLRARGDDVIVLTEHLLAHLAARYARESQRLSGAAKDRLRAHAWPGNIRELKNILEHTVLFSSSPIIQPEDISLPALPLDAQSQPGRFDFDQPKTAQDLKSMERELLRDTLDETRWNVSKAARALKISRDQLRYRIEKYGLSSSEQTNLEVRG